MKIKIVNTHHFRKNRAQRMAALVDGERSDGSEVDVVGSESDEAAEEEDDEASNEENSTNESSSDEQV